MRHLSNRLGRFDANPPGCWCAYLRARRLRPQFESLNQRRATGKPRHRVVDRVGATLAATGSPAESARSTWDGKRDAELCQSC